MVIHPLLRHLRGRGGTLTGAAQELAPEISRLAGRDISPRTVLAYARGHRHPRPDIAEAIGRLIQCDAMRLLTWGR